MITTAEQYNANLHLIHNNNPPIFATLPTADNIYNIDIKTREIDAPKFLAVEKDHVSETIYFMVDRYADYMDLATTSCVITYTNALGKSRMYAVPFYDIYSFDTLGKIIFPWCLDANVAEAPGEVQFYIQFFKVSEVPDEMTNGTKKILSYCLNTLPAKSKVLKGMVVEEMKEGYELDLPQYNELIDKINSIGEYRHTYWTTVDDE